jgi:acetyl-CoA carboxylase biotin carboxyl carrier protein
MASLDPDLLRHALNTAREHGFAEVELAVDGGTFRARLQPGARRAAPPKVADDNAAANGELQPLLIKSPIVGFYRLGPISLEPGKSIKSGDVVAVVNALGIANDVESTVAGEIVEVLVEDGQAVEFGQVLAKVKA